MFTERGPKHGFRLAFVCLFTRKYNFLRKGTEHRVKICNTGLNQNGQHAYKKLKNFLKRFIRFLCHRFYKNLQQTKCVANLTRSVMISFCCNFW